MTAAEEIKRQMEISDNIFADRLKYFVRRWGPDIASGELYDFQMDMMRLMVDAMRSKSYALAYGINIYTDQMFAEAALRPLMVIMEDPKK